jgi:hypothetical protein
MREKYAPFDFFIPTLPLRTWHLERLATWRFYLACVVSALLLNAPDTPGATLTVTNGNDSGAGSLRQVIGASANGDVIQFAAGISQINLTSGPIAIGINIAINGPGRTALTITASSSNVFSASVGSAVISISGITIANSSGAITNQAHMTISDCAVLQNTAPQTCQPEGCPVLLNTAQMTLTRCVISNNTSLSTDNWGSMTISDCTFSGNSNNDQLGGAILNFGAMSLSTSTISGNRVSVGISSFTASGGGIANLGTLNITNCTISGNSAVVMTDADYGTGGGIYNYGPMTITNCTISGNAAVGNYSQPYGGGIYNAGSNLQLNSSTIAYNYLSGPPGLGGGLYGTGLTRATSTIIALNNAPTGPDGSGSGGLQSMGYNLIGNNDGMSISYQPTDQIGTAGAPIDPRLVALANNGGPTFTHALLPGSPAINRGSPASPPQDQRGYGRVGVPDVGAFEFSGSAPSRPRYDFNRDGHPDYVLSNASTRQTAIWYLNNNMYQNSASSPTLPVGWTLIDSADFNGDGKPDYVLFNASTHATAIWYLNNNILLNAGYGPTLPSGWQLVATGDFNGDGKPDYVLYNPSTRQTAIWYLNNNVFVSGGYGPTLLAGWSLVGAADFNGDGKSDYLLFNPSTHQTAIWYLSGRMFLGAAYGPVIASGYQLRGAVDFNGNGKPDFVLFNSGTRRTVIWYLNNNAYVNGAYGPTLPAGWSVVAP